MRTRFVAFSMMIWVVFFVIRLVTLAESERDTLKEEVPP